MKKNLAPILVGVAQYTQSKSAIPALDPLGLMVQASREAFAGAGADTLRSIIDTVCVVNSFSWDDEHLPHALSDALGIRPAAAIYSLIGGNSPQMLVNRFARDIAAGRRKAVLLTGAEAVYALYRASRGRAVLDWQDNPTYRYLKENNLPTNFDTLLHMGCDHEKEILKAWGGKYYEPNNAAEDAYDLFLPQFMYPFFETALRNLSGRSVEEHQRYMGRRYEGFSRIASQNPHAWNRQTYSAEEFAVATVKNRYVVYPYTVRAMANINVDQSAALIMTNERDAAALGIDRSKWVYPMGGAELNNIWHVSQRPRLCDSPAITAATDLALKQSGLSLSDIGVFDLYSCFPSAVEISRQAIGIAEDDPRDLTITGGLACFGGPGNNYTMHAIVSAANRIRKDRSLKALITANGWCNSKHAIGVYGAEPPDHPWEDRDNSGIQKAIDAAALGEPVKRAEGMLTIEAYSMRYDQEGRPERATVIGRLPDGNRALADVRGDTGELRKLEVIELVGKSGEVNHDYTTGRNRIQLSL
ncbi:MAG: acetyl-CoA C-acetyltransferase [Syntrophus sp. SKADARSKE-3]|nr:acetyl-CoA C-acetyltransferase [Syntrophus sp. SKADARSKE-3]